MVENFSSGLRILRLRQVQEQCGLSRSTIYARVVQGTFPAPIHLGGRTTGWIEGDVQDWLQEQVARSRSPVGGD